MFSILMMVVCNLISVYPPEYAELERTAKSCSNKNIKVCRQTATSCSITKYQGMVRQRQTVQIKT